MVLPYAVVTFLDEVDFSDEDDDLTSEVPSTWLTAKKTQCWWPKTTNVKPYIIKRTPPVEGRKWTLCNVKLEGYYENLEEARTAAAYKKSESESSLSNSQHTKPYLRKRTKQLPNIKEVSSAREDSLDSDDAMPISIPEPPKLQQKNVNISTLPIDFDIYDLPISVAVSPMCIKKKDSSRASTSYATDSLPIDLERDDFIVDREIGTAEISNNLSTVHDSRTKCDGTVQASSNRSLEQPSLLFDGTLPDLCEDTQAKTRKIIEDNFARLATILADMVITQKSVDYRLSEIEKKISLRGTACPREDFTKVTGDLPFKNTTDIHMFEIKLADADLYSTFVKYAGQIGGNSVKENTLRILRQVFTNEVAKNASWCGLRENFQLSNLKVTAAIKDGVRLSYTCTDKDFEETVSEWFRQAKQRFKRENEKKKSQQHVNENE